MSQVYRVQTCDICGRKECNKSLHNKDEEMEFRKIFNEVFGIVFKNSFLLIDGGNEKLYNSNWQFRVSYEKEDWSYFLQVSNHMNFKRAERGKYECIVNSTMTKEMIAKVLSDFKARCCIH